MRVCEKKYARMCVCVSKVVCVGERGERKRESVCERVKDKGKKA